MTRQRAILTTVLLGLLLVFFAYLGAAQFNSTVSTQQPGPGFYRVTKVNDGDTIVVDMNGVTETVRFIGVDTPETHKPNTPVQCFGPQASAFTTKTLAGSSVRLESDPTNDNRDRYDRLLRYVYTQNGTLLNLALIEQGYGFAYTSFPFQKKQEFAQAQTRAQSTKIGLWAACETIELPGGRWQTATAP